MHYERGFKRKPLISFVVLCCNLLYYIDNFRLENCRRCKLPVGSNPTLPPTYFYIVKSYTYKWLRSHIKLN